MGNGDSLPKPTVRMRSSERRLTLIIGDFFIAVFSLFIAMYFWSRGNEWYSFSWQFLQERVPIWFYFLPFIWMIMLVESYQTRRSNIRSETLRELTMAAAASAGLYLILFFLSEPNSLPRRGVAVFIIAVYLLTILWRMIFIQFFTAPLFMRQALIIGAGVSGTELARVLKNSWPPPFKLIGLVDDDPAKQDVEIHGYPVLGPSENLFELIRKYQITDLIFAISGEMSSPLFSKLLEAEEAGIEVTSMAVVYEEILGRVPIFLLQSDWVLRSFVDQVHMSNFYELSKRLLDIVVGLVGCFFLVITFPFIALGIFLDSGTPFIYKQVRLGKNGKPYMILKFRTMIQDAERDGKARPAAENDDRATRFGKFLRKTHLDELPQFVNVLRGEMSMVGPRAERPEIIVDLQKHIPFYRSRLFVKPGLTGWAQVNFGYAADINTNAIKLEYDLYYIKHRTLVLDLLIMLRTVGTVVGFRGR